VDGIHSDIARLTVGLRLASLADGVGDGPSFIKLPTRPLVGAGSPQIVQVRYRQLGQALVALVAAAGCAESDGSGGGGGSNTGGGDMMALANEPLVVPAAA